MKRNSGIIGDPVQTSSSIVGIAGTANGVHDIHDVHIKRIGNIWPRAKQYVSLTPSTTTVSEGSSMTFTLVTEHIPNGSTLYYSISTVSGTTMNDADFSISPNANSGVSGSFTNTNDSTVLTFGLVAEISPGDAESNVFKLQIREGSTSGTVVIESTNITVTDVISQGTDIVSNFYEISNRYIVDSTSSDYTGNYDVGEVQQGYAGSGRLYMILKCTTQTTYRNDIAVAAVQVLNSNNVVQQTWNWSGATNQSWETHNTRIAGQSAKLDTYLSPSNVSSLSYQSITGGGNLQRIGMTTSTGSTYTGMADGIASGTTTAYTVGNSTVAQSSGAYYLYGEVSGAARYSHVIARSPSYTFSAGDKIRVVHAVVTASNQISTATVDDSIWIGIQ